MDSLAVKYPAARMPREETTGSTRMGLTVIIPAYNEAEFVGDTIQSLLAQTIPPNEIILVDDGSTEGTGDVGRRAGITVIRPPHNFRACRRASSALTA